MDVAAWIEAHGLPRHTFTVIPFVPPEEMVQFMHRSDVALFPNRAEGGTNLVAMEAIAAG